MRRIVGLAAALMLSACVQHTWVPGPQIAAPPGVAQGQCKLAAMGAPGAGGFIGAVGSPAFVGATLGAGLVTSVLITAVRQNEMFNSCMEAQGYIAAN